MIVYKKNKNFALRSESVTAVLALGSTESVGFVLERSRFQLDFRPPPFVIIMIDLSNDQHSEYKTWAFNGKNAIEIISDI